MPESCSWRRSCPERASAIDRSFTGFAPQGFAEDQAHFAMDNTASARVADMPVLLPMGTLIGFFGMVADSTLGALLQGRFHCPACDEASEWRVHRCGAATIREGGIAWLNNDGVNLVATLLAGCVAAGVWRWLAPG